MVQFISKILSVWKTGFNFDKNTAYNTLSWYRNLN